MPQYKLFSSYNEDDVVKQVNDFIDERGLLWGSVEQEFFVTATAVVGFSEKIIYKYFILLKYKTSDAAYATFQGE